MLLSFFNETETEAGCDEAGRGCLAGPVFAAAVILPKDFARHADVKSQKSTVNSQQSKITHHSSLIT